MIINDLKAFRADFEPVWVGAEAIFFEGKEDVVAHVRVREVPMSETYVNFRLDILERLSPRPMPEGPLEVGGKWGHISATRGWIKCSAMIGVWWIWRVDEVIASLLAAHKALAADDRLDDRERLERLKVHYREVTQAYRGKAR